MKTRLVHSAIAGFALIFAGEANAALVYYMPFDNGAGSSLVNEGTAGGNATREQGPFGAPRPTLVSSPVAPNIGSTFSGNFSNNFGAGAAGGAISLPNSTSQFRMSNSSDRMTISTWVRMDTLAVNSGIVNVMNATENNGWYMGITSTGKLKFAYTSTSGSGDRQTTSDFITTGTWYNVVATWNSSTTSALNFYVNGVAAPLSNTFTGNGTLTTSTGRDIALGTRSHDPNSTLSGGYGALDGFLDDFAMWDSLLSPAKIAALNTAPALLSGYDAGVMNSLFDAYDSLGSQVVGSLTWNYGTFDATGRTLGDTFASGGNNYIYLGGAGLSANGLIAVPEPSTWAMVVSVGVLFLVFRRGLRRRLV